MTKKSINTMTQSTGKQFDDPWDGVIMAVGMRARMDAERGDKEAKECLENLRQILKNSEIVSKYGRMPQ